MYTDLLVSFLLEGKPLPFSPKEFLEKNGIIQMRKLLPSTTIPLVSMKSFYCNEFCMCMGIKQAEAAAHIQVIILY